MKFQERLKLYMIGFLIGLLMVYVFFGNRSCVSLSEVKMAELNRQSFKVNEYVKCQLKCIQKDPQQLKNELEFFEVNFDKSKPREKPCRIYYLQPKEKFQKFYPYHLLVHDCEEKTIITEIIFQNNTKCQCP